MKSFITGLGFHICIMFILFGGCKSQKTASLNVDYHQVSSEKLGDNYSSSFNEMKNMVICVNDENQVGLGKVDYLIFDLDNSKMIYEKFNFMGSISWHSDSIIRIRRITGVSSAKNTNAGITYYDLINQVNVTPNDISK